MNPSASAPNAVASSASSSLVIPQILTNTRRPVLSSVPIAQASISRLWLKSS
jgi:hypothetical protein